jgi:hypothetical protein
MAMVRARTLLRLRPASSAAVATTTALLLVTGSAHAVDPTIEGSSAGRQTSLESIIRPDPSCTSDVHKDWLSRILKRKTQNDGTVEDHGSSGAPLIPATIANDGKLLAESLKPMMSCVGPGRYVVALQPWPTGATVATTAVVSQAELGHDAATPATSMATEAPGSPPTPQPTRPADSKGLSWEKIVAIASGGIAVAGAGVGSVFGALAISRKSTAQTVCPGTTVCYTQDGVNRWSTADSAANVSTLMFAIASLAALEAAVFWFVPDMGRAPSPTVAVGPGGLQVKAAW